MRNWENFINWRNELGLKGLATEFEYNEFINQVGESPEADIIKNEFTELENQFADLMVKPKVQETFEAIRNNIASGQAITFTEIAELTGNSLITVKRHVSELDDKGLLNVKRTSHTNKYYFGNINLNREYIDFSDIAKMESDNKGVATLGISSDSEAMNRTILFFNRELGKDCVNPNKKLIDEFLGGIAI